MKWKLHMTRDLALYLLGGAAFIHELLGKVERPYILFLCATMLGLPTFIKADQKRHEE